MKNKNIKLNNDWMTPPSFYNDINKIFDFDFDPFPFMHDIKKWDGFKVDWKKRNYVNPPYERELKEKSIYKAVEEIKKYNRMSVFLLPVSTSTKIFHDVIQPNKSKGYFVQGRLPFIGINSKGQYVNYHLIRNVTNEKILYNDNYIDKYVKNSGQGDSMLIIFDSNNNTNNWEKKIKSINYLTQF